MIILMKRDRDCHNVVIGTVCEVSYEKAQEALDDTNLPGLLESPVFSNPWNLYRALLSLGYWKRNLTLADLLTANCKPGKTIVLLHNPTDPVLSQHWVVWCGKDLKGNHLILWGDSENPRVISPARLKDYFLRGWPNCAFEVYQASIWRIVYEKIKSIFKR